MYPVPELAQPRRKFVKGKHPIISSIRKQIEGGAAVG
jgi:hypothetical protein